MKEIYKNDGLSPAQIGALDALTKDYRDLERATGVSAVGPTDQFNGHVRNQLLMMGVDLSDPRVHHALTMGASVMWEYLNNRQTQQIPPATIASLVMGALIGARPLREIE